MMLKGSQRGGARQMALHLLNGEQNEHVQVHEISGFVSEDVLGALNEIYAISQGTQCQQFMYSLSLSPPQDERVPIQVFEEALSRVEDKLGLEGQPRVVVFHEKEGRRHAHCVWSRIDMESMTAINLPYFKTKLNSLSKSLFLEHGWTLPEGFRDKSRKNPLNFTRAEWQQALRIGRKPQQIKSELQECWSVSDNKSSFEAALQEMGYYLAQGDRRGFVAVDIHGEVYSLTRQLRMKKKALQERLGKPEHLPSVANTKEHIQTKLSGLFTSYKLALDKEQEKKMKPLLREKQAMTRQHREVREQLKTFQKERWQEEEQRRASRIRSGFKGLFDKLNGRYWKNRKKNEQEAWQCHLRDRKQREGLIYQQLMERQTLQAQILTMQEHHNMEHQELVKEIAHLHSDKQKDEQLKEKEWQKRLEQQELTLEEKEDELIQEEFDFDIELEM